MPVNNVHANCISKGKVMPGYIYRKKGLYFAFIDPITEAAELKKIMEEGNHKANDMEAMGYGDAQTVLLKVSLLTLPKIIQKWLKEGILKPTIGYRLYNIKDDVLRVALARRAITERLTIRAVTCIAEDMKKRGVYTNSRPYVEPPFCTKCNRRLRRNKYLKGVPRHVCDDLHYTQTMLWEEEQ